MYRVIIAFSLFHHGICYNITWEQSQYVVRLSNFDQRPPTTDKRPVIWILGLFPMAGSWAGGQGIFPSVELALDHINANPEVLPDYQLAMVWGDTEVTMNLFYKKV